MDILGYKSGGHDGALCYLQEGRLVFHVEADKDSGEMHSLLGPDRMSALVETWQCTPHVLCGDSRTFGADDTDNYFGIGADGVIAASVDLGGGAAPYLSVSHELAHIASAYALSGLPPGQPFHALVWEGVIGGFYHVDTALRITRLGSDDDLPRHVGERYCLPLLATGRATGARDGAAAKVMALAGLAAAGAGDATRVRDLVDYLLDAPMARVDARVALIEQQRLHAAFAYLRSEEVTHPELAAICSLLQEKLFERFRRCAEKHAAKRLPLLVAGGCAFNTEWNSAWRASGLFESVFVPPVAGDSGIAIGAAAVVQHRETGHMNVAWDAYAGEEFVHEPVDFETEGYLQQSFNLPTLCEWLVRYELVVAWVQGRHEIGTKPLCHRSVLAAPFAKAARERLNRIQQRESFFPVDAVCLEAEVGEHFEWSGGSPHGLFAQRVRSRELHAITHADRTARVLTMTRAQDRRTTELLESFSARTGFGVLCNVALRFPQRGLINRTSDLLRFARENDIPVLVIDGRMFLAASMQERLLNCESPVHGI